MKIGIFDSGLGGLVIAKSIFKKLPKYDYIYLGDTKNLPYGEKTPRQIYNYTKKAVDFLFKNDCQIIVVACNTSSAWALRKIQQRYLPKNYPGRKVLGVVVPTLEVAGQYHKNKIIGVIATAAAVKSHIYKKELRKIDSKAVIYELPTPNLTPLIEQNSLQKAEKSLQLYLKPLQKKGIEVLVLGCTHYPILKFAAKKHLGPEIKIVSQDDIIPAKLKTYLSKHPEINKKLSKKSTRDFNITRSSNDFKAVANRLFGKEIILKEVAI